MGTFGRCTWEEMGSGKKKRQAGGSRVTLRQAEQSKARQETT
jgi:hypothetical protein